MNAIEFFAQHAGSSYNPATETPEEGKLRGAKLLAEAEVWAEAVDLTVEWHDDWEVGNHFEEFGEAYDDGEPETCEVALAKLNGEVVASLGCIDGATPEYRRVIEAELALEAMGNIDAAVIKVLTGVSA